MSTSMPSVVSFVAKLFSPSLTNRNAKLCSPPTVLLSAAEHTDTTDEMDDGFVIVDLPQHQLQQQQQQHQQSQPQQQPQEQLLLSSSYVHRHEALNPPAALLQECASPAKPLHRESERRGGSVTKSLQTVSISSNRVAATATAAATAIALAKTATAAVTTNDGAEGDLEAATDPVLMMQTAMAAKIAQLECLRAASTAAAAKAAAAKRMKQAAMASKRNKSAHKA